jgi:hypothetical protein
MLSILKRIALAIIFGVIVAFAFWFVGFLLVNLLTIAPPAVLVGQVLINVSYWAGLIAGVVFLLTGRDRLW